MDTSHNNNTGALSHDYEAELTKYPGKAPRTAKVKERLHAPSDNAARIRDAFGTDRDYPYTPVEIANMCARFGCTPVELSRRMVIRSGDTSWLMFNGDYSKRFTQSELVDAARQLLAPATTIKVELSYLNDKGKPVDKQAAQLMREYGTHATGGVAYDLTAQSSRYDAAAQQFLYGPCPIRDLVPTFCPEIDTWLRKLGGEKADRLLDWLAVAHDLTHAAPALVLFGASDAGKSLLAFGLSRIFYKGDPTSLDVRMSPFNGVSVMRCPIIFGDEKMTADFHGNDRFDELKRHIAADSFEGQDKFMPAFVATGALRYVLAANGVSKLFSLRGDLSKEDIDALEARFLVINATQAPVDYLRSLGGRKHTEAWVAEDGIAKHVLWLREGRKVVSGLRFAVPGHCPELVMTLATESGFRRHLLPWIFAAMKDTSTDVTLRRAVWVVDGVVWVNAKGIVDAWTIGTKLRYPGGVYNPPGLAQVRDAIVQLCEPGEGKRMRPDGKRGSEQIRYRQVQESLLQQWAQQNDVDLVADTVPNDENEADYRLVACDSV